MKTAKFDYDLPPELIAQHPTPERTAARLMIVDRQAGTLAHAQVRDLPGYLWRGDLLVVNDTRVIPARLWAPRKAAAVGLNSCCLRKCRRACGRRCAAPRGVLAWVVACDSRTVA